MEKNQLSFTIPLEKDLYIYTQVICSDAPMITDMRVCHTVHVNRIIK